MLGVASILIESKNKARILNTLIDSALEKNNPKSKARANNNCIPPIIYRCLREPCPETSQADITSKDNNNKTKIGNAAPAPPGVIFYPNT